MCDTQCLHHAVKSAPSVEGESTGGRSSRSHDNTRTCTAYSRTWYVYGGESTLGSMAYTHARTCSYGVLYCCGEAGYVALNRDGTGPG